MHFNLLFWSLSMKLIKSCYICWNIKHSKALVKTDDQLIFFFCFILKDLFNLLGKCCSIPSITTIIFHRVVLRYLLSSYSYVFIIGSVLNRCVYLPKMDRVDPKVLKILISNHSGFLPTNWGCLFKKSLNKFY